MGIVIGSIIKSLREERRMSQKELAVAIEMGTTAVNNYENGHRVPDADTVVRLSDVFGVPTDYLLGKTPFRSDIDADATCEQSNDIAYMLSHLRPDVRSALLPALEELLLASGDGVANYAAEFLISFSRIAGAYMRGIKVADGMISNTVRAYRLRDELLSMDEFIEHLKSAGHTSLLEELESLPNVFEMDIVAASQSAISGECLTIRVEADKLFRDIPPLIEQAIKHDDRAALLKGIGDTIPRRAYREEDPDDGDSKTADA